MLMRTSAHIADGAVGYDPGILGSAAPGRPRRTTRSEQPGTIKSQTSGYMYYLPHRTAPGFPLREHEASVRVSVRGGRRETERERIEIITHWWRWRWRWQCSEIRIELTPERVGSLTCISKGFVIAMPPQTKASPHAHAHTHNLSGRARADTLHEQRDTHLPVTSPTGPNPNPTPPPLQSKRARRET